MGKLEACPTLLGDLLGVDGGADEAEGGFEVAVGGFEGVGVDG